MTSDCLSMKYTSGLPFKYYKDHKEPLPSTYAIAWCMRETEVARLFTEKDMHEFLFRLPILFHLKEFAEDWLINGTLFNYEFRNRDYVLRIEDLAMHFGLEAYDHYMNRTPRERYVTRVPWSRNFPTEVGYTGNFSQLRVAGTRLVVDHLIYSPEVTPDLVSKASFFADDAMKFIPAGTFTRCNQQFREKEEELISRACLIENLHSFDLGKFPQEVLSSCLDKICNPPIAKKIIKSPSDADAIDKHVRPMIFLAWSWASFFTNPDGTFNESREGFIRDYLDYEAEDGGYNLTYNIELSWLEQLVPILMDINL